MQPGEPGVGWWDRWIMLRRAAMTDAECATAGRPLGRSRGHRAGRAPGRRCRGPSHRELVGAGRRGRRQQWQGRDEGAVPGSAGGPNDGVGQPAAIAGRRDRRRMVCLLVHPSACLHARSCPHRRSALVAVVWTLALLPDLSQVFGEDGAAPDVTPRLDYQWSVFEIWPGDTALLIGWVLLLVAAIAMTVGWHSRIAAIVVFVLVHSFHATRRLHPQRRRRDHHHHCVDPGAVVAAVPRCRSTSADATDRSGRHKHWRRGPFGYCRSS